MDCGFEFGEFKKLVISMREVDNGFDNFLSQFLLREALNILSETKKRTPVDTGALRSTWQITKVRVRGTSFSVEVYNAMSYASYIEFGTYDFKSPVPDFISVGKRTARVKKAVNSRPYIRKLKKDGKGIKPFFMVTVPINKASQTMPRRFQLEFYNYMLQNGVGR